MQPLVSLDGLTVAFNGVKVLDGISLSVGRGEAVGLVGARSPSEDRGRQRQREA